MTNESVLSYFWLPGKYYKTTSTGINGRTIRERGTNTPCAVSADALDNQRINRIITESRACRRKGKHLRARSGLPEGHVQIVNDALDEIYVGRSGFVFNEAQAISVCSFLDEPNIKIMDGYIYISNGK